jgi:hypothetical protein
VIYFKPDDEVRCDMPSGLRVVPFLPTSLFNHPRHPRPAIVRLNGRLFHKTPSIGCNRCGASGTVSLHAGKHSLTLSRSGHNCGNKERKRKNAKEEDKSASTWAQRLHAWPRWESGKISVNVDRIASLKLGNCGVPSQRCAEQEHACCIQIITTL